MNTSANLSRQAGQASGSTPVGDVSTHILRHTALATANDLTGDLRAVQEFARHADPMTTAGYTRVRGARLVAIAHSIDYEGSKLQALRPS